VDQLHLVDTKRWRKSLLSRETRREFFSAIAELKAAHYDAAIDFQGLIRSAVFARLSGVQARYGFSQPRESVARWFYTSAVVAQGIHVIDQNLSLAQSVAGVPLKAPRVQFPYDEEAELRVSKDLATRGITSFAILNPGAGWGAKQWPADRYGAVAKQLAQEGLRSLINFGPGEENLAREVETASCGTAQAISLSLPDLIALTSHASLFIGGDTGPMHLAAALEIPVVAIFGPTDPARNGPFSTRSVVLRNPGSITDHSRHAEPDQGLLQITVEQVIAAAHQLIGQTRE
jgi:heptosyltransferase-1